jgi:hypothetical protein
MIKIISPISQILHVIQSKYMMPPNLLEYFLITENTEKIIMNWEFGIGKYIAFCHPIGIFAVA